MLKHMSKIYLLSQIINLDAVQKIAKDEGIAALWKGIQTSVFLSANPAIQFMVYEAIKRFVNRLKRSESGKKMVLGSYLNTFS